VDKKRKRPTHIVDVNRGQGQKKKKVEVEAVAITRAPATKTSTVYYTGHRHGLPLRHVLNSIGQTRECCPEEFYSKNKNNELPAKGTKSNQIVRRIRMEGARKRFELGKMKFCGPANEILSFFEDDNEMLEWFEYEDEEGAYQIDDFEDNLFYAHCDYRSRINYTESATTDSKYLENGLKILRGRARNIKHSNGVYGVWPYVHLDYSDYQSHAQYGAMHAMSGVIKMFLTYMSIARSGGMSHNMKSYLKDRSLHPYLYTKTDGSNIAQPIPWHLRANEEIAIDCILACCLKPKGMHEEKAPKSLFQKMGKLKCAELINVFAYFVPYLLQQGAGEQLGSSYKSFFCMLAHNVRAMISRFMSGKGQEQLQQR
jgi:hypothetical protein